jgi:hypothetical protein
MSVLPQLETLPADIRDSLRGVAWKLETRDGKPTKVPYQARRPLERAAVNDPATWCAFMDAYDAVADGKVDGAGFVLGNGITGIDLDHCRDPKTGAIDKWARTIIRRFDSYTEESQSGTGVHIIVRGVLPPGGRKKGGLELYDERHYFVVTGRHLEGTPQTIQERTRELAAVHAQIFGPAPTAPEPAPSPTNDQSGVTLDDAAVLVKATAATNGARFAALWRGDTSSYGQDESAADLALCNLLAFWTRRDGDRMDRLFRQSGLMRAKWDSRRGTSTYGAQTIAKAIADCTVEHTPEITIEIDDRSDVEPDARQSAAHSVPAPDPVADDSGWPVLHADALVGVFGDLVRTIAPTTEADPVALLGHALAFWGSLVGRGPHALVGAVRHYLNENILLVGNTSSGRKGTAEGEIRPVMAAVDPEWAATRLVGGLSSGEGLIYQVRDALSAQEPIKVQGRVLGYQTVVTDDGVADKRLCVLETEFGKTLRVSDRSGNTLSATMRQAWDTGDLAIMTRNSPVRATQAHISLIAHITPIELRKELKSVDMASGFANRFLFLLVRRSQYLPDGGAVDPSELVSLIQRLAVATEHARQTGRLMRDDAATAYWAECYPAVTADRPGLVGALCTRAPAHVLRVSLLYALADQALAIRLEHVKAALALWRYSEASIRSVFRTTTGHRLADYLLALLRTAPNGLTRTELSGALGNNRRADEIHEALERLLEYGLASCVKSTATRGGRPAHRWFAIEHAPVATKETK